MQLACQKCSSPMEVTLSGHGRIVRCPSCRMLNAFLRNSPDGYIYFGDYRVIREAGQGANAIISKVRHLATDTKRALKMYCADELGGEHAMKEFVRESQSAKEMVHPNIVRVYDQRRLPERNMPALIDETRSASNATAFF